MLEESLEAQGKELVVLKESNQKLTQANSQVSTKLSELCRLNREGLAMIEVASKEASKWVERLSLGTAIPVQEPKCQSLPLVAEFIRTVAADVRTFKNKMVTQLVNDKHEASKQTAASIMATLQEANPKAAMLDFLTSSPS